MTQPDVARRARAHLRKVDPVLAMVMESVGPYRPGDRTGGSHLHALIRSIVFQQLSGKAATTIHNRFLDLYPSRSPSPEDILATSDAQLRSAGLSRQKIGYLRDLASRVHKGELPLDHVHTLSDAELIAHLIQVKGIGKWTAQMFLMFKLERIDVLPELDLGIQNAIKRDGRSGSKFRNGDTLLARITPCLENGKTGFVNFMTDNEVGRGSTEFISDQVWQ